MNKLTEISIVILGGVTMVAGILLVATGLYITPALVLHLQYDLPASVEQLMNTPVANNGFLDWRQAALVILLLIIGGLAFLGISRYTATLLAKKRIDDKEEVAQDTVETGVATPTRESLLDRMHPLVKLLLGIAVILLVLGLAEFLLTVEFSIF